MKPLVLTSLFLGFCPIFSWIFSGSVQGDVVINEIAASSSERVLRFLPDGRPRVGWGKAWNEFEFDDSGWEIGTAPFGYGTDDIATDLGEQMDGVTPSLYLRQTFTVSAEDATKEEPFRLSAMADSGFVAFINGHEIARGNLGRRNLYVYHDQSTFASVDDDATNRYDSEILASEVLRPGENVFAVQVQNSVPKQINERQRGVDNSLRFEGSLTLGLGIFAGGSNIRLELPDEGWRYRVGFAEPSGGLVDWAQSATLAIEGAEAGDAELPDGVGSDELVADPDPDFSDWIELHNNGAEEVDLTGWGLTDDEDLPHFWTFPEGTTIPAGGYLVVLADERTAIPGDYFHATFKLAADGEFIGLANAAGEFVDQWEDGYPNQNPFHTFGKSAVTEGEFVYFSEPSPGLANGGEELGERCRRPSLEPRGGVYDEPVDVTLATNTDGATIRYTLDGTEPTPWNGIVYEGPITVEPIDEKTGTAIRARAFKEGCVPSNDSTQTYLVGVDEVFSEIPSMSVVADEGYAFYTPHGMWAIEGGTGLGDDWRSTDVQDYYMPDMHGRPFERQVSMEMIYPDDNTNVQIDCGIRLAASAWSRGRFTLRSTDRSPWASNPGEKPSFNMFFRNDYGDDTLNFPVVENYPVRTFHQLRLRAGKNDINNPWITDELSRRLMADTGQPSSIGVQNAFFVNGVYKGYFNTVSRLREELFQDLYGNSDPWQVKHIDVWADGSPYPDDLLRDTPQWDHLESLLAEDLSKLENYLAVLDELDPVNFADYFIVNIYGATWDWPHNNLVIARALSPEGRWRAYMWDAEGMFGTAGDHSITYNTMRSDLNGRSGTTPSDDLATVWNALMKSPEWRLLFADRLQKHFFTPGGALTKENMTRRMNELADDIDGLMRFTGNGTVRTNEIESWIDRREDVLLKAGGQFEDEDLWGEVQVPNFSPGGGAIESGTAVKVTVGSLFSPQRGDIYYTVDGSDSRMEGGQPNPDAILYDRDANTGIPIETTTTLKARVRVTNLFDPAGNWSPLMEADFRVGLEPATAQNFIISELMVDPASLSEVEEAAEFSRADFEYLEFHNPTDVAVDLAALRFTAGIDFVFSEQAEVTTLGPGAYGVIVNDRDAFTLRYGEGILILGQYNKKLRNEGEHLEISNGDYEPIVGITYSDSSPWPEPQEVEGHSYVRTSLDVSEDGNEPENWAWSAEVGGSPGRAEGAAPPEPTGGYEAWKALHFAAADLADESISGLAANPDGDDSDNLTEYAFGTLPLDARSSVAVAVASDTFEVDGAEGDYLTLTQTQRDGVAYALERSDTLDAWESAGEVVEISAEPAGAGLRKVTVRTTLQADGGASYLRWRVELAN